MDTFNTTQKKLYMFYQIAKNTILVLVSAKPINNSSSLIYTHMSLLYLVHLCLTPNSFLVAMFFEEFYQKDF